MTAQELTTALKDYSPEAKIRVYDASTGYWYDPVLVRQGDEEDIPASEGGADKGDPVLVVS